MSDTPRTDAKAFTIYRESSFGELTGAIKVVPRAVAMELERENAELKKRVDELEWILQPLKAGKIRDYIYTCQQRSDCFCWACQIARVRAALEAAKGAKE